VGKELYKDIDAILQKQLFSARLAKQLEDARKQTPETTPRGKIDVTKLGNENAGPKDDPTKKLLEGQLRAQEDFIAAEKSLLQTREQTVDFYRNLDYLSLREAEQNKQALLADNLQTVQAAYDKEIAALKIYIKQADKEVERQDGRNKLAEAQKKRTTAEIDTNKQIGDSQNRLLAVQRQFDLATTERARSDTIANAQALFQIDMMGKSTLEVEKLSAARKIQMDLEERIYRLKKLDPEADTSAAIAQATMQTASATSIIELCYHRQRDAIFGASEAVRKYQEDATNSGLHIENAMTRAFQGMEDALVTFATTGKLSFKSLADSIVADITRIIIKQQIAAAIGGGGSAGGSGWLTNLASMAAGALFGTAGTAAVASSMGGDALDNMMTLTNAFGTAPGRALGGPVSSGGLYEVNENGQPELLTTGGKQYLMMGAQSGTVTPHASTPARGDTYVTVQVSPPVGSSRETAQQWGAAAGRQLQQALRRNG
jgi:lambda family phage tail tape measure protein